MKDKKYYVHMYKDKWNHCLEEAEKRVLVSDCPLRLLTDIATEIFEETVNAEEVVGYYIYFHGNSALKVWMSNTEGIKFTDQDREIDRILKELYL